MLLVIAGSGCGYHLAGRGAASSASFLPRDVKVIGLPPLRNETDQPEIEQRISEALADEFVRRGRYETRATADGADVVLEGTITGFRSTPVSLNERGRADRLEVVVTAQMRLVRRQPIEQTIWSQSHFVFREQYDLPETPQAQFEREIVAVEDVAKGFARSVVTSLLEGF